MKIKRLPTTFAFAVLAMILACSVPARAQIGLAVSGVGPINRSMGGAAVAAPIDPAGSLYWNPASIGALDHSEMLFGVELLIPRTTVTSSLRANSYGPGIPATRLSGTNGGNNGVFPLPTWALVYQPEDDTGWTYGIGFFTIGGFGLNYPASRTNPVLMPQFPYGTGAGAVFSQYMAYQAAPTVACRLTDELFVGVSANIDVAQLSLNPALFTDPTSVQSPLGAGPNYPSATNGRPRWGAGFSAGVYWAPEGDWRFGASIKSPQWFEPYTYNSVTATGMPTTPKFELDFPMIVSIGTSYTGFERFLIATDVRFVDYRNTNGFRQTGYNAEGALQGLGWQNVVALALGVQYQATDQLTLRTGYSFSMNPIGNAVTAFNVAAPTNIQNSVAAGLSYDVTQSLRLSATYVHFFENTNTGPIIAPGVGAIPGSSVKTSSTADSVVLGASVAF